MFQTIMAFNSELDSALQHLNRDFTSHDPNFLANKITQTYVELIEKYMPLKKLSINHKRNPDKPWITQGLKKSIRTKFKLYKKARNSGKENHWSAYKKYLNVLTHTKKKAEFLHYKKMSVLYGHDKSKTWKLINEISQRKRKCSHSGIKSLRIKNGIIIKDPSEIANCLNDHFSGVGGLMAQEIESNSPNTKDPISYIRKNVDRSMFMNFTNSAEISEGINKLQNKKSSGYDLISNCILKSTNLSISPYLELLFNT